MISDMRLVIIGGGILCTAHALAAIGRGHTVVQLEREPDLKDTCAGTPSPASHPKDVTVVTPDWNKVLDDLGGDVAAYQKAAGSWTETPRSAACSHR